MSKDLGTNSDALVQVMSSVPHNLTLQAHMTGGVSLSTYHFPHVCQLNDARVSFHWWSIFVNLTSSGGVSLEVEVAQMVL